MQSENIQGQKYGPVGECIYCGAGSGRDGLGDEHIIPYSLGGKTALLGASCTDCGKVTSYLDGYLARSTFWNLRAATGTQSRGRYPEFFPVEIKMGEETARVLMPAENHAFFTHLPVWGLPGVMRGEPLTSEFGPAKVQVFWYVPPDIRERLGIPASQPLNIVDTTPMPNLRTFARAILKIGYCHAVMRFGLDGFRRLFVPDIILGKNLWVPYFVGAELDDPLPPADWLNWSM